MNAWVELTEQAVCQAGPGPLWSVDLGNLVIAPAENRPVVTEAGEQ